MSVNMLRKGELGMSIQLTKPLVVPEYVNAIVKMYTSDPVTSVTVMLPSYTIDVQCECRRVE